MRSPSGIRCPTATWIIWSTCELAHARNCIFPLLEGVPDAFVTLPSTVSKGNGSIKDSTTFLVFPVGGVEWFGMGGPFVGLRRRADAAALAFPAAACASPSIYREASFALCVGCLSVLLWYWNSPMGWKGLVFGLVSPQLFSSFAGRCAVPLASPTASQICERFTKKGGLTKFSSLSVAHSSRRLGLGFLIPRSTCSAARSPGMGRRCSQCCACASPEAQALDRDGIPESREVWRKPDRVSLPGKV